MLNAKKITILVALLISFALSSPTHAAQRVWYVRQISNFPLPAVNGPQNALATRSDGTWPVVAYGNDSESHTASMGVTGWRTGSAINTGTSASISAASGADGKVGFAWSTARCEFWTRAAGLRRILAMPL